MIAIFSFGMAFTIVGYFVGGWWWDKRIVRRYESGDLRGAIRSAALMTRFYPRHTRAWVRLSALHAEADEPAQALNHIERAIETNPRDVSLRFYKADALDMLGRTAEADAIREHLEQTRPDEVHQHKQSHARAYQTPTPTDKQTITR
ncbi:MAG: tetratricopeptide repeat protein [Anaerolineaceae bacterium]|nr:MAG: tetratricopeptide repeat protein [Anaerolineaceae bacterium]